MKPHWPFNPWITRGLQWLLGSVFLYAGIVKLFAPQDFADNIEGFRMLPNWIINPLASALPCFEILIATMLFTGWQKRAATLAVGIVTTIFIVALVFALGRGLNVDCGCFGGGIPSRLKNWVSLGRDVVLVGLAAMLYLNPDAGKSEVVKAKRGV